MRWTGGMYIVNNLGINTTGPLKSERYVTVDMTLPIRNIATGGELVNPALKCPVNMSVTVYNIGDT